MSARYAFLLPSMEIQACGHGDGFVVYSLDQAESEAFPLYGIIRYGARHEADSRMAGNRGHNRYLLP
jgi:hypothetical protein